MSTDGWRERTFSEITHNLDKKRKPLSSKTRSGRRGKFPYYGAQGIIDYIDDYIFDGTYLLIAEDGENLKSKQKNVAQLASGQFWVNNHAHIIENNEMSDIRFICYLFNHTDISGYVTGSAQPKLSQANLNKIKFLLPPLPEQKAIADTLSCLDDKIELNNQISKNLEAQAQTIFKNWFVDFEPFQDGEFVDSELGRIPKGWSWGTLGDFFPVITGKKNANVASNGGKYPFFSCSQSTLYTDCFSFEGEAILVAGNGDFNVKTYTGKFEAYQRTYVLMPRTPCLTGFLYYAMQHGLKDITSLHRGSVIKFITKGNIADFRIAVPSCLDIMPAVKSLQSTRESYLSIERENQILVALRDTLLPKLMSGELRVPLEVE